MAKKQASSGMAKERYRTSALVTHCAEDASLSIRGNTHATLPRTAGLIAGLALCAAAQVTVTPGGDSPLTGPGTKYPTLELCNQTNTPQVVDGWKFRTKDFTGYNQSWMGGFSHTGTAPVDYTQMISDSYQQIQSGACETPVDYSGTLAAGQDGTMFDVQELIKTGTCNEVPPYKDAASATCDDVKALASSADYKSNQCLIDTIGSNGGDTYGGFVSSFYGQTQIQAAIPSGTFNISGTDVRWDPYRMGPQYMMALGMAQEIMNVDMQFMIAIAGKETGAGMVNIGNNTVRSEDGSYTDNGTYGYWQIEQDTYGTYIKAYPEFFPKYGPCVSKYPDVTSAISAGHCAANWGEAAKFYMEPAGQNKMMPNSPQIANGVLSSAIAWYDLYDIMVNSTDLCFIDAIQNGVDKRIAFAAMIGGYNLGRYTAFADPLKNPALKDDPNASSQFPMGNNNYRTDVYKILDVLVAASKNCASRNIYDTAISITEVQRFLFGGSGATPGTPAAQSDGGLMLHYPLDATQRQAMWDDVTCAFNALQGKAPSMASHPTSISYRYDWLPILRVVKSHLPFKISERKTPVENDFNTTVKRYSANPRTCSGKVVDGTFPTMTITSPANGSTVSPVIDPGFKVAFTSSDNVKVAKAEWTFDKNWLSWNPATNTAGANYEFYVSCQLPGYPKKGQKDSLWIRTTDDCGNSTVQQLNFTAHSTMNCGDPPVPPQVATPSATPPGRSFSALLPGGISVTLNVVTPGASILYTVDGSDPDTVVGGKTLQYAGPIAITNTATLKARGVMTGLLPSDIMTETYTMTQPGKVAKPVATPPGQNFAVSLNVFLTDSTQGAAILYTLDGSKPGAAEGGATHRASGPITLTANTTITAVAIEAGMYPSDTLIEKYTMVPPVKVVNAYYLDVDGDGRIDQAVVAFDGILNDTPAKFTFTITDESGNNIVREVAGATQIRLFPADGTKVNVYFPDPFPFGVTSNKNPNSGTLYRQDAIPLADGTFPVADSVAPVIVKAEVKEPGDGGSLKRVLVTYSEPVNIGPGGQPLIFKRSAAEAAGSAVIIADRSGSGSSYAFSIDSNSTFFPIVGDSVAITPGGQTADAGGRAPTIKLFRVLEGVTPPPKPVSLQITFPNNTQDKASAGATVNNPAYATFIPVDQNGASLAGSADDGRCIGCTPRDANGYVGPVFHIITPGPVEYEFKIFNNFGEFVADGKGKIKAEDLGSLIKRNDASGVHYEIPVVWTGATRSGYKAGTGAYILVATFVTDKDPTSGAGPGRFTEKKLFGLLRSSL